MVEFDPTTHTYTLDGKVIPSVTQILQAGGVINVSPYAYPETGTAVHGAIEIINTGSGEIDIVPQSAIPRIQAYIRFVRETGTVPLHAEQRVHHPALNYAGTYDLYALYNDAKVLIDIKTGKPEEWHKMQLVAYRYALRDGQGITPRHCYSLYLQASGKYRLAEVPPMEIMSLWGQFQRLAKQYKEKSCRKST